ncbi:MAG TPA: TlpA disulfide reductase family protein [Myxococcota bacterium]|nr:TlpA disulfide reductase family protein [Myxococcota bacterium]
MRYLAAAVCLVALLSIPAHARDVGERLAPDTALGTDLAGEPMTLARCGGKPTLLVFWASWCSDCMRELPTVQALHKVWRDKATVLGVSTDASERDLRKFLKKNAERFTITVSHDEDGGSARAFDVRELPTSLLIDRDGTVRWRRVGFDDEWLDSLDAALKTLAKPNGPQPEERSS